MKPYILNLLFAISLLWTPVTAAVSVDTKGICAAKKKKKKNSQSSKAKKSGGSKKKGKQNANTGKKPRVVGKRDPLKLPPLSSKAPKNIKTKPYKPPPQVPGSLRTYVPTRTVALRMVGTLQKSVSTRQHPVTLKKTETKRYSIATRSGDVPLSEAALQRGGLDIDLDRYVGHRVAITGDVQYENERTQEGPRFHAIRQVVGE